MSYLFCCPHPLQSPQKAAEAPKSSLLCNPKLCVSLLPNLGESGGAGTEAIKYTDMTLDPFCATVIPLSSNKSIVLEKPQLTDVTHHKQNVHC